MILLHGAFDDQSLLVWGEAPSAITPVAPGAATKRTLTSRKATPPAAWFDANADVLITALAEANIKTTRKQSARAIAWLPATKDQPLSSSGLLNNGAPPDTPPHIAPWSITAIVLGPADAISLLASCWGQRLLAPGVGIGTDLAYWAAALRFAGGLAARGQFLPAVEMQNDRAEARWRPFISGADAEQLHALARAMPPSARAVTRQEAPSPPAAQGDHILRAFLSWITDRLIRDAAAVSPGPVESVHDDWLRALRTGDAVLRGSAADLRALATQAEKWRHPIEVSSAVPFRLCFRLEEPAEPTLAAGDEAPAEKRSPDDWYVRYLLQSSRDPSLLIPAPQALGSEAVSTLGVAKARIQEYLLSSLGQAGRVSHEVEASLAQRHPDGYPLDTGGAHRFLRETALLLGQSGFGVMLPAWWTRRGSQARLKLRAAVKSGAMKAEGGLSLGALVDFNWEAALGDQKVTRAELAALARMKTPLVRVRGQWVEVNSSDIEAALDFMAKKQAGTVREVLAMAVGAAEPGAAEIEGVTATGWIGDLLGRLEGVARLDVLPQPHGMHGRLREYQLRGYSWLRFLKDWGLGACLADDMGLGKTVQMLAVIQAGYGENGGKPVLMICPTSVIGNWQKEAARFTPDLPVMVHHGVARTRGAAFARQAASHAIVLSSYALLQRDAEILKEVEWAGVVLDEAQNIKNPETKQARAARALPAGYRVALTGTPVENNVGDLWSLMEFLNPGFLGSQSGFRKRFFLPIQVYSDRQAAERLKRVTQPFVLRRLKTDKSIIADLPEKLEMKVFCTLTREQASLYEAVVREAERALESSEGIERKGVVLATLSKLKQVCNHPTQFLKDNSALPGRSGKLARLTEMLEETIQVGDRSLVFTQFAEMGELLRRHLLDSFGAEILFLHGGVPKKQRDAMVDRFEKPDGPRIFLLSLKAGGTGLNLVQANHVFHFDRWWNPAVENQATDRAFRIGQTKNVQVHKFVCAGTLEEKIDDMIERKKDVAGQVIGTGEAWLTELSNRELKDLFALRKEAIAE